MNWFAGFNSGTCQGPDNTKRPIRIIPSGSVSGFFAIPAKKV